MNTLNSTKLVMGLLAGVAVFGLSGPASAEQITGEQYFGWLAIGTTYTISEGHVFWLGEFSGVTTDNGAGTILDNSAIQCPAWWDLNYVTGVASAGGYCVTTLTTGDSYAGSWVRVVA